MHNDFFIERYGITLFGLICGAFTAVMAGAMIGEWTGIDIGLLDLADIYCLAARTGFAVAFFGSMLYLFLFLVGEGQLSLPGAIAWHGLEFLIAAAISVVVVVYGLDGIMPWYLPDAQASVPLSIFAGLLFGWLFRFVVKDRLIYE